MTNIEKDISRVAIATGATREEAVSNALALVRKDILAKIRGRVLIKPNFLSSVTPLAATQAGAVRPVLELLRDAGYDMRSVVIAEGGSRSTPRALDNFGYRDLAREYGVECVDLNHDTCSRSFGIVTAKGGAQIAEYSDFAAEADTVISVPIAKTHDTAGVTLSLKNMMGCLKRVHRPRMHGITIPDGISRIAEAAWNAIEGHPMVIKSFSGVVFTAVNHLRAHDVRRNSGRHTGLLRQVGAMAENLCRLGRILLPDIAVIDAFEAMEGNGPGSAGTAVDMRVAVTGTDAVACDAVMAHLMGYDPLEVGYLALAHECGLGTADIDDIGIVGCDPSEVMRSFTPHSNHSLHLQWREGLKLVGVEQPESSVKV